MGSQHKACMGSVAERKASQDVMEVSLSPCVHFCNKRGIVGCVMVTHTHYTFRGENTITIIWAEVKGQFWFDVVYLVRWQLYITSRGESTLNSAIWLTIVILSRYPSYLFSPTVMISKNKFACQSCYLFYILVQGFPNLFWFKPPLTLKFFHVPPPSTVLGNQVTNCKKWRIIKIEEFKNCIFLRNTLSVVSSCNNNK
jgi:hypothetical protein